MLLMKDQDTFCCTISITLLLPMSNVITLHKCKNYKYISLNANNEIDINRKAF